MSRCRRGRAMAVTLIQSATPRQATQSVRPRHDQQRVDRARMQTAWTRRPRRASQQATHRRGWACASVNPRRCTSRNDPAATTVVARVPRVCRSCSPCIDRHRAQRIRGRRPERTLQRWTVGGSRRLDAPPRPHRDRTTAKRLTERIIANGDSALDGRPNASGRCGLSEILTALVERDAAVFQALAAATVAERGSVNAVADAAVAALIAESVCRASALTVRVNVAGCSDAPGTEALTEAAADFADAARRSAARAVMAAERACSQQRSRD
jgi:hypothetical protein